MEKQKLMFKHEMTFDEQQKHINTSYYVSLLPDLNVNFKHIKNKEYKTRPKNKNFILNRMSVSVIAKPKKKN